MILCRWIYKTYKPPIIDKYFLQNVNRNIFLNIAAEYELHNLFLL